MVKHFLGIMGYANPMSGKNNGNAMQGHTLHALEDFGALQARYQPLGLAARAKAVLADAEPVVATCQQLLDELAHHAKTKEVFEDVRKNPALTGKMRPSEAKNVLMDKSND